MNLVGVVIGDVNVERSSEVVRAVTRNILDSLVESFFCFFGIDADGQNAIIGRDGWASFEDRVEPVFHDLPQFSSPFVELGRPMETMAAAVAMEVV